MNGFHAKHIFFTNIGENLAKRLFRMEQNLLFKKEMYCMSGFIFFSAKILFSTPKLGKTHFKKKMYFISVFHAKRIFQQEMVKIW